MLCCVKCCDKAKKIRDMSVEYEYEVNLCIKVVLWQSFYNHKV